MRVRAVLTGSVVLAGSLTATAHAAPRRVVPACNLVTDAKGDVDNSVAGSPAAFPADDGLDILSGDVASNASKITAVMRLAAAPGSATVYAKRYITEAKVAGLANPLVLAAAVTPTGTVYSFGWAGTTTGGQSGYTYSSKAATGSINGSVITVTAALADVAGEASLGAVKKGAKVSGLRVTANRRVPSLTQVTGQVLVADEALGKSSKTYAAGAPSCVTV
jgi:opacity protein-like surface antigen